MIIALMVITLVAALAGTVTTVTINNLQSSQAAQDAGIAVNAADAGVAQAVSYLRTNGVRDLCAAPTVFDKTSPSFDRAFNLATRTCVNSQANGTKVSGQPYSVLIVTEKPYKVTDSGTYWIYSTGSGKARGLRQVSAKVRVTAGSGGVPNGFFGRAILGAGQTYVNQSIFTTGCVYLRSHINMSGIDAYGLPAAVHSSQIITEDQGTNVDCSRSQKSIHNTSGCNVTAPFDQDVLGDVSAATGACLTKLKNYPGYGTTMQTAWDKYYGANGSKIATKEALYKLFSIQDPPLSDEQKQHLKDIAKAQDNYTTNPSKIFAPDEDQAVVYYELAGGIVDLSKAVTGFNAPANNSCPTRSLVIVIDGGGSKFPQSSAPLVASVFITAPGYMYDTTGGQLVGSVFADKISLGGNAVVAALDIACFLNNPSPSLLDFNVTSYRELDSIT